MAPTAAVEAPSMPMPTGDHGDACPAPNFELVVEQRSQALRCADDEDDLGNLGADLQAEAARTHAVEEGGLQSRGWVRAISIAGGGGADDESALHQLRHDQHTARRPLGRRREVLLSGPCGRLEGRNRPATGAWRRYAPA